MLNFSKKGAKKSAQFTQIFAVCTVIAATQLVACTKSDDKKTDKKTETSKTDTKAAAIDCNSPNAAASIQKALTTQIAQQSSNTVQQLVQQAGLNAANVADSAMQNSMAQLMVNVQNLKPVAGQPDQCQGTVAITLPAMDVANANQIAASLNQPTLVQRLSGKGLTLENNTVIAQNVGFKLTNNAGNYSVMPVMADSIINEVSNVLANSQLRQIMLPATATPTLNSTVSQGAGAIGGAVMTAPRPSAPPKPTPPKPKPIVPADTDTLDTKTSDTKISDVKIADTTAPKTAESSTTQLPADKAKPVAKPTTPAKTAITEKTVIKAVPNDNTKLTIEEKNEKY